VLALFRFISAIYLWCRHKGKLLWCDKVLYCELVHILLHELWQWSSVTQLLEFVIAVFHWCNTILRCEVHMAVAVKNAVAWVMISYSYSSSGLETEIMAMGICCSDHATPSIRKSCHKTLPKSGSHSVSIVHSLTKATEFVCLFVCCCFLWSIGHLWHGLFSLQFLNLTNSWF
jgi:hypothetical protein